LQSFPPDCIDLTVTSPPYDTLRDYHGYTFDFETIAKQLFRVTKAGGVVVWVVADETIDSGETLTSFRQALFLQSVGFNIETMIYRKTSYPRTGSLLFYQNAFEYMFIAVKGSPKTFNPIADKKNRYAGYGSSGSKREADGSLSRYDFTVKDVGYRDNVWDYDPGFMKGTKYKKAYEHPAIFPEGLARDHILTWTNENDVVLDVCAGSGTTLDMAKRLSRHYLGIEISPEYVALAEKRLLATPVPLFGQGLTPRAADGYAASQQTSFIPDGELPSKARGATRRR
jgi:site-specific DNA-methyltransferase (adenine-specific)